MAYAVADSCIGCGACEFACQRGAISQTEQFQVMYVVDPLRCDDCADCVSRCPVSALSPDPAWAVCYGRGCPLSSTRYAGWRCTTGDPRCPGCGSMLWQAPDGGWICSRCRLGEAGKGASCPKIRSAEAIGRREPAAP